MKVESLTFALALLGYAGLATNTVLAVSGKYVRWMNLSVIPPIALHMFLV